MTSVFDRARSGWPWIVPVAAAVILGFGLLLPDSLAMTVLCLPALLGVVLASVHHSEVVAHRIGEPFGTLVLALAMTVIEVALIVSVLLGHGPDKASLPRDTIFATIMIICNGVIGLCLLVGGLRHHEQSFRVEGTHASFAALITLSTLTLVLPTFTMSSPGPTYTSSQLAFCSIASLALWTVFIVTQTVRHRGYFLHVGDQVEGHAHASSPTAAESWRSGAVLAIALLVVVGLAKRLSPSIEAAVAALHAPKSVIGIAIALLVLLPETWAALMAARANRLQTSLNLALGSALASIGLTIPVVGFLSVRIDLPLNLGLDGKNLVLLVLTFVVGSITFASGRTNIMLGAIHLVIFAVFLFLSLVP
jgi:Ca2+:H+ antiporter